MSIRKFLLLICVFSMCWNMYGCERDYSIDIHKEEDSSPPETEVPSAEESFESLSKEVFKLIDLEYRGLEKVKASVNLGDYKKAAEELLQYYRDRRDVQHPDINLDDKDQWAGKKLHQNTIEMAENGMKHLFFVHKGYGYFDYGEDIDWQHWPVKDNEVRWQLHRMYWWIPMGEMYLSTQDEKFAKEWIFQFRDWVADNPLGLSSDNDRFAWRPLETSRRVQDQTTLFNIFLHSDHFTSKFLIEFLDNYYRHAERISANYSKQGNHLLFEAQRMIYAGGFFREFKNAPRWRKEGIAILNNEIRQQINADGYQYELSPDYHLGAINTFLKGLEMAKLANMENEFPSEYLEIIRKMIHAVIQVSYPDFVYPMFGDAKLHSRSNMSKQYKNWAEYFPEDKVIEFYASNKTRGEAPNYLSSQLLPSGFHILRNGWDDESTVLIMRAGIPGGPFHSQPDNGTFELWHKGINLMPDSGSYVYSGDSDVEAQRNWYRQSSIHQTLTLNDQDIEIDAKQLQWSTSNKLDYTVYENQSYVNLKHRRSVFLVDKKFFVILDEAIGKGRGDVKVRYQVKEGKAKYDVGKNIFWSENDNESNIQLYAFSDAVINTQEENLKVSYEYKKELPRKGVAFAIDKKDDKTVRLITIIYPTDGIEPLRSVNVDATYSSDGAESSLIINVDGKDYVLGYKM